MHKQHRSSENPGANIILLFRFGGLVGESRGALLDPTRGPSSPNILFHIVTSQMIPGGHASRA